MHHIEGLLRVSVNHWDRHRYK